MTYHYGPNALVYNATTNTWALKPDYDHTVDRRYTNGWDDDTRLDGDRYNDEIGDDSSQYAEVYEVDGTLVAAGQFYSEEYHILAKPDGGSIRIDRIEIGGQFMGWLVSEPLVEGQSYNQASSGDVHRGTTDTRQYFASIASVPCFGPGTMIATDQGELPVEWIRPGDLILTRDNGVQPVLWIGQFELNPSPLDAALAKAGAIDICAHAFAPNLPAHDLRLSPNHRVLLSGAALELHFGAAEMFAAARFLVGDGIRAVPAGKGLRFHHLLLPRHEVILANGLWVESLLASDQVMAAQPAAVRQRIETLAGGRHTRTARPCLKPHEVALLTLAPQKCARLIAA